MRNGKLIVLFVLVAGAPGSWLRAQTAPATTPTQPAAASQPVTPAASSATSYQDAHLHQIETDWPQLGRYREANLLLPPPPAEENRVVFLGDSITDSWPLAEYFPGKPYINRGISGQTTPQMLVRMRQDVIALKPRVMVILAGTNDIAQNTGPETVEQIEDNFASICDVARANGVRVVLASILPVFDYPWRPGMEPIAKIATLNAWMKKYAAEHGQVYLDYYSAMQGARHGLPQSLSKDGVHPNAAGYGMMAPLAEKAIAEAER